MFAMKKNRSIAFIWFVTYLTVLSFPMFINMVSYVYIEKQLKEEVHSYNLSLNTNRSQCIDGILGEAQKVGTEISHNTRVQEMIECDMKNLSPAERFEIYKLSADLKVYRNTYPHMARSYIYLKDSDAIISETGVYDVRDFCRASYSDSEYGQKLIGYLQKRYIGEFTELKRNDQNGEIAYILSVADLGDQDIRANVVVELDKNYILNTIMSPSEEKIRGFVMLENNNIVAQRYSSDLDGIIESLNLSSKTPIQKLHYGGQDYMVSCMESGIFDFKYVYIMNEDIFKEKINKIQLFCATNFIICIVIGLIMILYMIRKNYKPIDALLKTIGSTTEKTRNNEFDYIQSAVLKYKEEMNKYNDKLSKQEDIIRSSILSGLIKERNYGRAAISEIIYSSEINFQDTYFFVIIFCIDDVNNIFYDESKNNKDDFKLAKFIISNIFSEMMQLSEYRFEMCDNDELLCCVVNIDSMSFDDRIVEIISNARQYIKQQFNIEFISVISDVHMNFSGVAAAYSEAENLLGQRFVMWNKSIIKYSDFQDSSNDIYYYPLNIEEKITNYIKTGEFEELCAVINELFSINFEERSLPQHIAECFMIGLTNTIIKAVTEVLAEDKHLCRLLDGIDDIVISKSAIKMKEKIIALCKDICQYVRENADTPSQKLCGQIMEYIQSNYFDADLNVMKIAEEFNMNANYISNVFRQQTGSGILEYIAKFRIEKTKQIMHEQNISNEALCKMVGYTNVRTFSRVFTKYLGISPGKYKENLTKKKK